MGQPDPPPEGVLLRTARQRHHPRLSIRAAAQRAGYSEGRWRQIEAGYERRGGLYLPVRAHASPLAQMARAVGVTPEQLSEAGREDAASELREMAAAAAAGAGSPRFQDVNLQKIWELDLPEEVRRGLVALAEGMRAQREREEQRGA